MTDADDTLRMLEDAARGFAAFDAKRLRGLRETAPGFDRDRWKAMAEQGWLSILIGEDDGGLGLGIDAAATVAKELGRTATPEPFVAAGVMTPALLASVGVGQLDASVAEGILSGEHIATMAWQNTTGSIDPADTEVSAKSVDGGFALSGDSRFVPVAHADSFLVVAQGSKGLAVFHVPASSAGLTVEPEPTADGGFSGWLTFNDVRLDASACLAEGDAAADAVRTALDLGMLANCAELVGNMEQSLDMTLEYLKTRKQFGQSIGSFQVLQHRAVDLWMKKKVTQYALDAAIRTASSPDVPARARMLAASSAKSRAAEVAHEMANECIQLHGAIGFTDEYDLSLFSNRALAIAPFLGNAAEHRRRYGTLKQQAGATA